MEIARELIDILLRVEPAAVDLCGEALEIDSIAALLLGGTAQNIGPENTDPVSGAINPIALPLTSERTGKCRDHVSVPLPGPARSPTRWPLRGDP